MAGTDSKELHRCQNQLERNLPESVDPFLEYYPTTSQDGISKSDTLNRKIDSEQKKNSIKSAEKIISYPFPLNES